MGSATSAAGLECFTPVLYVEGWSVTGVFCEECALSAAEAE
ncbi:MAG: hypothetical protein ACXQTM_07450 [Methanosarcinales archaeon]